VGLSIGVVASATLLAFTGVGRGERLRAPGSMNAGHEGLACADCHQSAPGTLRQQLQANVRYLLGLRTTPADFGAKDVENGDCLSCHARPDDRHPVFRFNEPRFREARQAIAPERCESCHREHRGQRVTVANGFCSNCHEGMSMKQDPLAVTHAQLAHEEAWSTCLECHDFHGNHRFETPTDPGQAITPTALRRYFEGGEDPYGGDLKTEARRQRP
jgi:hypothetical protein